MIVENADTMMQITMNKKICSQETLQDIALGKVKSSIWYPASSYSTFWRSILMRLYSPQSPVYLTGNVNMIEKLVLGRTETGDLPILSPTR